MRNLLCVIGRHDWQIKHHKMGGRTRFADDRGVITFEVMTLGRTGHTPEPIQVSHRRRPLNQSRVTPARSWAGSKPGSHPISRPGG